MAGDAFVIRDRLVVDQRARREVRGCDDDASRTFAVRTSRDVVRGGGGLKSGYGFDSDRRLRKQREQFRKLRLHLGDVATEIIQDLLRGGWDVFRIRFERGAV